MTMFAPNTRPFDYDGKRPCRLIDPSRLEQSHAASLRLYVTQMVAHHNLSVVDVAEILGLLPAGVSGLFARQRWDLPTAYRVVEALQDAGKDVTYQEVPS